MSKNWIVLGIFGGLFVAIYYFSGTYLQNKITPATSFIRDTYLSLQSETSLFIDKYLSQAESVERLEKENIALQKELTAYKAGVVDVAKKINAAGLKSFEFNSSTKIGYARVRSYSNLPNLYRIWIDFNPSTKEQNQDIPKIYGLIYPSKNKTEQIACGIAMEDDTKKYEAFLNGDPKCSYGVYIGGAKAPGVVYGKNQDKLIVKYIPTWMDIKAGDEVITSGLDNIFFEGVKVGKIKSVSSDNAYKEALVEGYYNSLSPDYFYVVEKAK